MIDPDDIQVMDMEWPWWVYIILMPLSFFLMAVLFTLAFEWNA